jgi:hypothetical protein
MGLWSIDSLKSLERIFDLRVENIFTEPLFPVDYEHYLRLKLARLEPKFRILSLCLEYILLKARPGRLRFALLARVNRDVLGRNLVAIYTKP